MIILSKMLYMWEPHREKTCLQGFRPVLTQTQGCTTTEDGLRLEMERNCTIFVAKTKVLISCAVADSYYPNDT